MSVSGVSSSDFYASGSQSQYQQRKAEFQQLGQDLQSGNLAQAQQDYTTLTQQGSSNTKQSGGNDPMAQAFNALGNDLQSGNVSAAQQDYANLQQSLQRMLGRPQGHGRHHHHHAAASTSQNSAMEQAISTLGQALQSGNLTSAQQAFSVFQSDVQQFMGGETNGSSSTGNSASGSTVNVSA